MPHTRVYPNCYCEFCGTARQAAKDAVEAFRRLNNATPFQAMRDVPLPAPSEPWNKDLLPLERANAVPEPMPPMTR